MRVGVMLRTMDEKQGIGVYTQNLMDALLELDTRHEWVLFYRNPRWLGRYAGRPRVREMVIEAPNKAVWDQIKIPYAAWRADVDVIFHTKFTVPFLTRRPTVMALHGASWYTNPEVYRPLDIFYVRRFMPLYCRKATAIMSNSECTTRDFVRLLHLDPAKLHTANLAAADRFRPIDDPAMLADVRARYALPDRFVLSVIKYDPRKNFGNLLEAFREAHAQTGCSLVVVGRNVERYRADFGLDRSELGRHVHFLGWVEQSDLPAIYNQAECLFFPSIIEEFGIPVCEAMACGLPMVVSSVGAPPDIAGEAGIFVDPLDPNGMAEALIQVLTDPALRAEKRALALARARHFSWRKCAEETLAVLEQVARRRPRRISSDRLVAAGALGR
ncbi:MAG TPA: glycosyltransferase family 1 protein [Gemmatimonadales bacterium]|nr:glycosyltransferase family 1 protein [Gemmatimonadales bacterium]